MRPVGRRRRRLLGRQRVRAAGDEQHDGSTHTDWCDRARGRWAGTGTDGVIANLWLGSSEILNAVVFVPNLMLRVVVPCTHLRARRCGRRGGIQPHMRRSDRRSRRLLGQQLVWAAGDGRQCGPAHPDDGGRARGRSVW